MVQKLGKWIDYLGYLFHSNNRHGIHSPFVYSFADFVLYSKENSIVESIEYQRTLMLQSKGKIHDYRLSSFVDQYTLSSKFGGLLKRICEFYNVSNIYEFGWCTGIETNYLLNSFLGNSQRLLYYQYFNSQKNLIKEQCNQDFWSNHNFSELTISQSPIDAPSLYLFHWSIFDEEQFWIEMETIIKSLKNDDIIIINGIRENQSTIINFNRLKNDFRFTVSIDLFQIGIFYVRNEQPKQDFILRF
jgi:hypothetical protein